MRLTRCDECATEIKEGAGARTVTMSIDRHTLVHDVCSARCVPGHLMKMADALGQQYLRDEAEREKAERDRIARQQGVQR